MTGMKSRQALEEEARNREYLAKRLQAVAAIKQHESLVKDKLYTLKEAMAFAGDQNRKLREHLADQFMTTLAIVLGECCAPADSAAEIMSKMEDRLYPQPKEANHEEVNSGTDRPDMVQGGRGSSAACEGSGEAHNRKVDGRTIDVYGTVKRRSD
jgi:hypothetical protein